MKRYITLVITLLLLGGIANEAWAYKVTYHILTKPIDNSIYHLDGSDGVFSGKRLEAVRIVDKNATGSTKVGLPAVYKSPLAKNFRYYLSEKVNKSASAVAMYAYSGTNKSYHYTIANEADSITRDSYSITENIDVYVTYEYDAANSIYKLDGSKDYNLSISGGFLAFNRGRNNRVAIIPESANRVSAEALASDDFVKIDVSGIPGTSINPYWKDNKNPKDNVGGQFHFKFQLVGKDPYNILIRTAYNKNYTYIEQHGDEKYLRYKYYKDSYLFWPSSDGSGFFLASDDHKQYTQRSTGYDPDPKASIESTTENMSGYFHGKGGDVVYNSFALLNNTDENGYLFMITRYVNKDGNISDPGDYKTAKYNFLARDGNYNNLKSESKTLSDASASYSTDEKTYLVNNYVFKVRKKISGTDLPVPVQVSEYYASSSPLDFVPDELKRKYVTFTGAFKEEGFTNEFTTFADVDASATTEVVDGKTCRVIWLKYETNMPFDTWRDPAEGPSSDADGDHAVDFDELKWYNFYVNKSTRNSAYWDGSKIKTSRDLSKYARASHFAFVGDPFDLTIVGRKASEDGSGDPSTLNYMKLDATPANNTAFNTTGTTWGIVYDDDTGDNKDCFRLKDNSDNKYLHQNSANSDYPLNGIDDPDEAVRLTVAALPLKSYVYYIMRSDNTIAAMSSGRHEPSAKLGYNTIPTSIRSPFINGLPVTFYGSYTGSGGATSAKSDATDGTPAITYAKDTENGELQYIVVRYTFASGNPYYNYINNATYNVRLNGQFIYYDGGTIKSKASITDDERANAAYQWILGGQDPYAMTIKQSSANKYVTIADKTGEPGVIDWPTGDKEDTGTAITWSDSAPTSKYIIKSSTDEHSYEVMGATGEAYDAMEESFNIGRPSDNTVKMYSDLKYLSGGDVLRFELIPTSAIQVTYHLVDIKNNTELLSVQTRQANTSAPVFPADYRSPLVDTYTYWSSESEAKAKSGSHPSNVSSGDIWVTYTANDKVDMTGRTMYLLKYAQGENFRQEDGSDGLLDPIEDFTGSPDEKKARYQAVYPYCNGDGNFFVYGQEQYDIQQQSAASTRTRWAWYVESTNNDPYHVKIRSRQQETYPAGSGNDYNAYFRTYPETYGDGTTHVVTNLSWPGISGEQGTEYMVLGSAGQFRLVTSDAIAVDLNGDSDTADEGENVRRTVNSFEQYWKTWNTIRLKVLGDKDAKASQSDPNTVPETPAAPTAAAASVGNRTYLTDVMHWHSYEQWAYAIRWNDYNKAGDKNKKGWEDIEHWFQTVNMGEGYFDFVATTIDPALILLDQHGWEIMRKALPTDPDDPDKAAKYDAIRPYDSPMVKEYHFWGSAKKRSGYHQYYDLSGQMKVDGKVFTSTSLTTLPDYYNSDGTRNTTITDAKGNQLDQYVTYVVKDEYLKSCNVSLSYTDNTTDPADSKKTYSKVTATVTGVPFLIQQGSHFVYNNSEAVGTKDVLTIGGMSKYIIDNIDKLTTTGDKKTELWYLMPNHDIDQEMGYDVTGNPGHAWASDYDRKDKVKTSGFNSWAFDPYNIQISSVSSSSKYFVTDATTAEIDEGSIVGNGTTNALGAKASVPAALVGGMDNRTLQMTNATFMAVQDANGNMQLMPRFDHSRRLKDFSTLVYPDDVEKTKTYTKLYRPQVYTYKIIDNDGKESLRYQGGGDLVPQTPDWFKSPLAKDYEYYKNLTLDEGVYTEIKNKTDISAKEITESLVGAAPTDNIVYVRYSYDEDADDLAMLKGKWLTMKLNAMDAKYDEGIKQGASKPTTIDKDQKVWQWKFLKTPHSVPDPYAVQLFNRNVKDAAQPATDTRYAILSHTSGGYALAQAGLEDYTYAFLNGAGMNTTTAASLAEDTDGVNASGFTSTSCTFHGTDSQVRLINDVSRLFNYKIYTNSGVFAVSAHQDNIIEDNTPTLPDEIKSPLLNIDQFRYYEALTDTAANSGKQLTYLYGLYDDIVYVRYNAYDDKTTKYKVPNVRNDKDGANPVAKDDSSNDASLDISGDLIYNIIWYDDNMMKKGTSDAIDKTADQDLQGGDYVWQFEGYDPYAIKIKNQSSGKYAVGTPTLETVAANASPSKTFMLLPSSDDWEYGVLQVTGDSDGKKLTDYGETLTANASTTPTRFIIFGLSTNKVIYHLVIANIGGYVDIPYSEKNTDGSWETGYSPSDNNTKRIDGSTCRDLTTATSGVTGDTYQLGETKSINSSSVTYCVDQGHITLGDSLKVPQALLRPNCKYFFYVGGIYSDNACTTSAKTAADASVTLDSKYKGLQVKYMGKDADLLGTTVVINIEYQFDDGLPTNNGSDFVTNTTGTQWYTFETSEATPYLANFTYKDNKLKGIEGRIGHYTNEFLWSPVGDPYGFKMYNRYVYKNGTEDGHANKVMTTADDPAAGADLIMAKDDSKNKPVYELLPSTTDGYFKVQTLTAQGGTPYYVDNSTGTMQLKSSTTSEWTFGLNQSLFDPYYLGAGNVGGLNETGKTAYEAATTLMAKQAVVYDPANIVNFTPGYYRIFSQPNSLGITIPRYLSGYTHKTELTEDIPMHFYEKEGVTTTFDILGSGFTSTAATRGQIPIVAPEYDPASIFYISGSGPYTMQTQGLYVNGAAMTESSGSATSFEVVDIGGAVVLLRDNSSPDKKYLHYKQTGNIYDVKFEPHGTFDDDDASKWCMEPANKKGLWIETHSGGEEAVLTDLWYYSSYCVPFDMLIQNKDEDDGDGKGVHSSNAYTCVAAESTWDGTMLHPKPIGKYNTGTYEDNDYFVPAGTPVLFSTRRATSYIKATIPTTSPSTSITTIFSAKYLEQLLPSYDDNKRVYVFGPKMEGTFTPNTTTGEITAVLPSLGNTNVGFHINANLNKESGLTPATWTRNNYYVLHNRIYYQAGESPSVSAPSNRAIEFVPVIFDDEEGDEEISNKTEQMFDGRVYNLQGRCVATEEQVKDGTWRDGLAPGIYIVNGKKLVITRK